MKTSSPYIGLVAIFLFAFGIWQSARLANLEAAGVRAPGQVVRLQEEWSSSSSSSGGGHYTYYPIVRFRTAENETIEFKNSIGSNLPSYRSGDNVTILYSAADPRDSAMIDLGLFSNWATPMLTLLGALFATGMALFRLWGGSERSIAETGQEDSLIETSPGDR